MNKLKTIDFKGKPYVEVNERIRYFRETYEDGSIVTDITSLENGVCIIKAQVLINGSLVATGHAYEKEGSSFINKTSYIENCETSAIGRALGILGIGIDSSVASYDEIGNAVTQQEDDKKKKKPKEEPKSDYAKLTEQEAFLKGQEDGKAKLIKSLEKPLNISYKDTVIRSVCGICEVKEWKDITFKGNLTYEKLTNIVLQELQKEKDLAEAGV